MTAPKLELKQVNKTFHTNELRVNAVRDVSFAVMPGELVTLVGPSGSGKSTLFNMVAGLLEPDSGSICLDGQDCASRLGMFGYMPQRDMLLPWRTVLDNAIIPLELAGVPRGEARQRAMQFIPRFGLEGFETLYPSSLSGGMRQRAALLRTIMTGSDVLLLDEPFGALDALTRRELQDWLLSMWQDYRQTMLFITHDVEEAVYLGDRVIAFSERPGHVIKTLQVDLPRPRRQGMVADPAFGAYVSDLLAALGVEV